MKLVIDNKEYPIKPITLALYEKMMINDDMEDLEILGHLTDIPRDLLKQGTFSNIRFAVNMIRSSFAELDKTSKLDLVIEFNGKRYGLMMPSKISYEEWVNLEVFMAETPVNSRLLATHLYRPLASDKIGEERELIPYSLDECMARQEEFGELPIQTFISALFFLTTFVQEYTEIILSSTETKMTEKKKRNERKKPLIIHKK